MHTSCPAGCPGMLPTLSPREYDGIVPGKRWTLAAGAWWLYASGALSPTLLTFARTSAQEDVDGTEVPKHGDATAGKYRRRNAPGSPLSHLPRLLRSVVRRCVAASDEASDSPAATQARIQLAGRCPIFVTLCTLMRMATQQLTGMCTTLRTLCSVMRILRGRRTIRG